MKRFRIATLMTVTLYFAIGMGAILDRDPPQMKVWMSTIYTLTAFILMISTLMSFIESGRERRAWIGFSVFGWAYLLLLGFEVPDNWGQPPLLATVRGKPRLLTTWVLGEICESSRYVFGHSVETATFTSVGHAYFSLIFGMIGALIGYALAPRQPHRVSADVNSPSGGAAL
jgi:hypothetical protein